MAASGYNEGCRVLEEFVCDAIPATNSTVTAPQASESPSAGTAPTAPITVTLSPELMAAVAATAQHRGITPETLVLRILHEQLQPGTSTQRQAQ